MSITSFQTSQVKTSNFARKTQQAKPDMQGISHILQGLLGKKLLTCSIQMNYTMGMCQLTFKIELKPHISSGTCVVSVTNTLSLLPCLYMLSVRFRKCTSTILQQESTINQLSRHVDITNIFFILALRFFNFQSLPNWNKVGCNQAVDDNFLD